ncbi:hypothetical protein GH5_07282 [Leishmania sp. Ghana 2012 LV757]|uniref:hypothetical protein n=1 Tax=Leishmania sp. Ghana 2012 LV757 TaxID=2803181 RepID=UPI001B4C95E1|nr:hypothetical protein GH5_07282 [Leishmania sp. Ghana 2012 LV757]
MDSVTLPVEWEALCVSDAEVIQDCINGVFRRLLANLLLDFNNPKFRQVKKDNKTLHRLTESLPSGFVEFLFSSIGFVKHDDAFIFEGSPESLVRGDTVLSHIERTFDKEKHQDAEYALMRLRHLGRQRVESHSTPREVTPALTLPSRVEAFPEENDSKFQSQHCGREEDVMEERALEETVRKTLLNTGRVRNGFLGARDFNVRIMRYGRVYVCTEKCPDSCIEVHWHLLTGRNILYSHLAHLSDNGTQLLHLGPEHGYQYNSLPGSANFRKMIHFSEKLIDENGKLVYVKTDDKPVTTCIYCGRAFAKLLL